MMLQMYKWVQNLKTNWTWLFLPSALKISLMWDPEGDQTWFSGYMTMTATALITPLHPSSSLLFSFHQSMFMSRGETGLGTEGTSTRRMFQASPTFLCQSHKIIPRQVYPDWMSVNEAATRDCGSHGSLWELNWAFKDGDYASLSRQPSFI